VRDAVAYPTVERSRRWWDGLDQNGIVWRIRSWRQTGIDAEGAPTMDKDATSALDTTPEEAWRLPRAGGDPGADAGGHVVRGKGGFTQDPESAIKATGDPEGIEPEAAFKRRG
jgi:hypothetical protein